MLSIAHRLAIVAIAICPLLASPIAAIPVLAEEGAPLDLTGYTLVFDEEFETLDVSPWGPGTRWIAHTPWNGDFGLARFADPGPDSPFSTKDGILHITAKKDEHNRWRSGLLSSHDRAGYGFSLKYGYFEIRAKLPPGEGLWSAFWLIGVDGSEATAEIDIFEHYGDVPHRFTTNVHVFHKTDRAQSHTARIFNSIPKGLLYSQFNLIGALIEEDWIRIYLNRKEIWRTPTPPLHRQERFILLNLALDPHQSIEHTPSPSVMHVDYVKVWARPHEAPTTR